MWVHGEADCFWFIWPPFWGWLQKFHNTDIVSLASLRVILEPPSAVFSVCQNRYQKLVFCWEVFWQMHKLQIHKLVSRHDHLNISTMYSIFDWKEFELLSYRQAFLESTEINAPEEQNALEKAPVQFIPFRKLSGKIQFLVWFYTSNWNGTYWRFLSKFVLFVPGTCWNNCHQSSILHFLDFPSLGMESSACTKHKKPSVPFELSFWIRWSHFSCSPID